MPLLLPSSPPTSTRVLMRGPSMASTCRLICPSLSSSTSPTNTSEGNFLYAIPTACVGAGIDGERRIERELGAVGERHLAGRESVDADLRALQIAENTHVASGLLRGFAHAARDAARDRRARRARN